MTRIALAELERSAGGDLSIRQVEPQMVGDERGQHVLLALLREALTDLDRRQSGTGCPHAEPHSGDL